MYIGFRLGTGPSTCSVPALAVKFLTIVCEPCGRRGRYNVQRLVIGPEAFEAVAAT
jgi:hypothetical protein